MKMVRQSVTLCVSALNEMTYDICKRAHVCMHSTQIRQLELMAR